MQKYSSSIGRGIENGRFDTHTVHTVNTGGSRGVRLCQGCDCFCLCCSYREGVQSGESDRWLHHVRGSDVHHQP